MKQVTIIIIGLMIVCCGEVDAENQVGSYDNYIEYTMKGLFSLNINITTIKKQSSVYFLLIPIISIK